MNSYGSRLRVYPITVPWAGLWDQALGQCQFDKIDLIQKVTSIKLSKVNALYVQGVYKKRYFFDFRLIYVLETGFNFYAYDFELKFWALPLKHSNYIHPESKLPLDIVIKYMEVCKDATAQASHLKAGIKSMFAHVLSAFLEQFGFWVDAILATSWNGIEILILKHLWKVKSDFLSRNKTKMEKVPFFRDTL